MSKRSTTTKAGKATRANRSSPAQSHTFVTWNCLAALPQHYDALQAQPPHTDIRPSLRHNRTRHAAIVRHLAPHIDRLAHRTLDAIALQEVDAELLHDLRAHVRQRTGEGEAVIVYTSTRPYIGGKRFRLQVAPEPRVGSAPASAATGASPRHDFGYWLVTLVRKADLRRGAPPPRPGRFLVTPLRSCKLINAHVPWVDDAHPQFAAKATMTENNLRTIAQQFPHHPVHRSRRSVFKQRPPTFVVGDLNWTCPLNQRLYAKLFPTACGAYQAEAFGESYKLSPEHIAGRSTFAGLPTKGPDDGCIVGRRWRITSRYTSVRKRRLPVNAEGAFVDVTAEGDAWPSDHALVEVDVAQKVRLWKFPQMDKRSRQSQSQSQTVAVL